MKTTRIELKAELSTDDAGAITGIAWPYAKPDRVGDIIVKGAFSAPGRMPMLFAHDQSQAVGIWDEISETDDGLTVKGRLLIDDVARAREVRALVKEGAVTGLSIGFVTRKANPRKGGGRTIYRADLLECSVVPVPMHQDARITSVKGKTMTTKAKKADEVVDDTSDETTIEDRVATLETDVASLKSDVAAIRGSSEEASKALGRIETKLNRPGTEKKKDDATAERKAFATYLRYGPQSPVEEIKTLVVSGDPQGGYLAPREVSQEFIRNLVEFSPIRALATVRSTTAASVSYPKRTGVTNALWKGETQAAGSSEPAFGQVEITAREVNTYTDISNQLLADSGGAAEAEVRLALAEDFGQKEGLAFVSGSGPLEPEGIMSSAGVGYTPTGNGSTLGSDPADLLITHFYSLPATYRQKATWLMNGTTLAAIRKLKDGTTGVYLWQPAYAAGQPETILGRPVVEVVDMDDVGAAAEPILFGDIATAFRIVDRLELSILVNPYILATNGVTRIHATRRVGSAVVQPAAIKKIRCANS
ncbi:MAG: phage major capsid protein [Hyphomicrobiaceae bacterium]